MSPRFWDDYRVSIQTEIRWYRGVPVPEYRVFAADESGHVILGAKSWDNFSDAYWRLCDFIDGELALRGVA